MVESSETISNQCVNWWLVVSIVEFISVCILLIFVLKQNKIHSINMHDDNMVDFGNVINSAFKAKQLYDLLKVKCHPDRFPDDNNKNAVALEIFQEISKNKNNIHELEKLKLKAEQVLGVKI